MCSIFIIIMALIGGYVCFGLLLPLLGLFIVPVVVLLGLILLPVLVGIVIGRKTSKKEEKKDK